MTENKTIFHLFKEEPIQNSLPTESNHFTKQESKNLGNESNTNIFESFVSMSLNYFKDSKHGAEDYFYDETDNECGSNFVSKKELQKILYKNSKYKESDFSKLSKLGNGSYGHVFRIRHKETNKIYALKEMNKLKLNKEDKLYQIYVENEMLKICSHKNIIKYYGFYENNSNFSIIEEYCPYGDLSSFLNENKNNLTLVEIQYIIAQIITCLEYLSHKKIIHRDIKPENFLITDNFTLKLIDFGTATFLGKIFDPETNQFIDDNYKPDRISDSFIKNVNSKEQPDINANFSPQQSFQNKIMSRNVFRYKRRVIMSLLGFIGCTSLLMSGYAIKDSMLNIIDKQFNEISYYDQVVNLDGDLSEGKLNELFNYDKIENLVYVKTTLVEFQDSRATFIIPNDINNFKTLFNLKDYKTGEVLEFKNNEVIITASLADNLHKKVGDEIEFVDNNVVQKFKISAIAENYVNSYIYMDKQTYSSSIGKYFINCAFIKFDNLENTDAIITTLNENDHVLTTMSVSYLKENFKTMLKAFDSIIIVLIVFSALLSFVVMYSLAYITLSERQREIATLKVLGYSGKEIDDYILKEQLNIVILGIIFGIITGSLYSTILVSNIRFSQLYLIKQIEPISYVKTAGFIFIFAVIVGIAVHFMLKKLKMIESLKSVE